MITVATFRDFTDSQRVLDDFTRAITADERLARAAPRLDRETGQLKATVVVDTDTQGRAEEAAIGAFYAALAAAGYEVNLPGWKLLIDVDAMPSDEP